MKTRAGLNLYTIRSQGRDGPLYINRGFGQDDGQGAFWNLAVRY